MLNLLTAAGAAALLVTLAQQQPTPPDQAASQPSEVCLTNACAEAPPQPASRAAPTDAEGRVIGPPPGAPPGSFLAKFNGNAPRLLRGRVVGIEFGDPNTYVRVAADDGKVYRVEGGAASRLTSDQRAGLSAGVGKDVVVRGFDAWDTSCAGGCLVNGRDISFADGSKFMAPVGQVQGAAAAPLVPVKP